MATLERVGRARELLELYREEDKRLEAEESLLAFTRYCYPRYEADPFHELVAKELDAVVSGDTKRLMIFAPPQSGKSTLASVHFPAFWLAHRQSEPVMLTSYAANLAHSKSRQARAVLESTEFGALFPHVQVNPNVRAVDEWILFGQFESMRAAGVGGGITGHGAQLGIIDDPVADWEQAQSPTYRERCWEWYLSTFRPRVRRGGATVLIQTRWHQDDLAGHLLREQAGRWRVLRLPAIAETQDERDANNAFLGLPGGEPDPLGRKPGEPLAPGRFNSEELREIRADVGSRVWSSLYQGVPRPAEGNRFKRVWFATTDDLPSGCVFVRWWDKASTEGDGDYTAGVLMARTPDGKYIVADVTRGQWSPGRREAVMLETAAKDKARFGQVAIWHEQEGGSAGRDSAEATTRNLASFTVHSETSTGEKAVRAEPFAAQAEAGNVKLLSGEWNGAYVDEVTAFPSGAFDDQVDASSGAFGKLRGGAPIGHTVERQVGGRFGGALRRGRFAR